MKQIFFLNIFITVLLINCTERNSPKEENTFTLMTDSARIQEPEIIFQLGVSFSAPLNWKEENTEFKNIAISIGRRPDSNFQEYIFEPHKTFIDKNNFSSLTIGSVKAGSGGSEINDLEKYCDVISGKFAGEIKQFSKSESNGLIINIFVIQRKMLNLVKAIITNKSGQIIQFDYSFQNSLWESEIMAVKASIASIRLLE